jgi:hypothetical protein
MHSTSREDGTSKEKQKQKVIKKDNMVIVSRSKHFQEYFGSIQTREDRNLSIINAYMDGLCTGRSCRIFRSLKIINIKGNKKWRFIHRGVV